MFSPDSPNAPKEATLEWNIKEAKVKNRSFPLTFYRSNTTTSNTILRNVAGSLTSGELVALVGASGSGKSTLLSLLAGQSPANIQTEGQVLINGYESIQHLKNCTALVTQFHTFPRNITPREHILFHALLGINSDIKDSEKISIAEGTLKQLGLSECADNKVREVGQINEISGGQRRKLGLAVELISNPKFLICDEPTSGLDGRATLEIIKLLKDLTRKGMGVLCSIHQPSSRVLELFDKIILLAEGEVAFIGTTSQALDFFNRFVPGGVFCSFIRNPAISKEVALLAFNCTFPFNSYLSTRSNFPTWLLWIKYIVFQNYAMNSFSAFIFSDLDFTTRNNQTVSTITGLEILKQNSIPYDTRFEDFGCLIALGVCYRLIQVACLHKGIRL